MSGVCGFLFHWWDHLDKHELVGKAKGLFSMGVILRWTYVVSNNRTLMLQRLRHAHTHTHTPDHVLLWWWKGLRVLRTWSGESLFFSTDIQAASSFFFFLLYPVLCWLSNCSADDNSTHSYKEVNWNQCKDSPLNSFLCDFPFSRARQSNPSHQFCCFLCLLALGPHTRCRSASHMDFKMLT